MGLVHLWDNSIGPPAAHQSGAVHSAGARFVSAEALNVTGLRWYAGNTTTTDHPYKVVLWDVLSASEVAVATIPDGVHSIGWQTITLGSPFLLTASRVYEIAGHFYSYTTWYDMSTPAGPPYPLNWSGNPGYAADALEALPNVATANTPWVDIVLDTTFTGSPPSSPPMVGDVNASLAAWFDPGSADLPVGDSGLYPRVIAQLDGKGAVISATKAELDAVQAAIDAITNVTDGNGSIVALPLKAMLARYSADIATIQGYISQVPGEITSGAGGGGTAFYGPGGTQVSAGVEKLIGRAGLAPGTFPGTGWATIDTSTFADCIAYAQPADLYTVTVDLPVVGISPVTICGVDWYPRLLWYCLMNGTFLSERHFGDFATLHVSDGGRRMPGLFLHLHTVGTGTVEAWQYTAP